MSVRFQAGRKMRCAGLGAPAAAVAVALLLMACGSAASGGSGGASSTTQVPGTSTTPADGAMTLRFTVFVTGAVPATGSFSVRYPPQPRRSCSSWFGASSELPELAETVGGRYFYMVVGLKPGEYHGQGTYAIPPTASLEAIDVGSHQFAMTGAAMTVNADGSGSLSFKNKSDPVGDVDSGTIRWTCS